MNNLAYKQKTGVDLEVALILKKLLELEKKVVLIQEVLNEQKTKEKGSR
jgi:hypothetical protein